MPDEIPPAIRSRCLEVFFRDLEKHELKTVAKKAADKIQKKVAEEGLDLLTRYARNGREVVNMMQIAAGMALTEERDEVTVEDIEWVIHSSQLTPKYEQKIASKPQVGIVNGLAVHGPNSGSSASKLRSQSIRRLIKDRLISQALQKKRISATSQNRSAGKAWRKDRSKTS